MDASIARLASAPAPSEDKLEAVRNALRELRDLGVEAQDLQARLAEKQARASFLQTKHLVELFESTHIDQLGLQAEGNMPAYDATLRPYYKANISAEWEPERQAKAFNWLGANGHEDMVRTQIIVELGRGERKLAKSIEAYLKRRRVPYSTRLAVPWNTLTAWLKDQIEKHQTTPPLELLGATVGKVVNIKPRKE